VVRRDETRQRDWRPTVWIYAHLPLTLAIALAGAGTEELIVAANGHEFEPVHWWLAAGGVATAYLAMAGLLVSSTSVAGERDFDRRAVLRAFGAGMALTAALLAGPLGPITFALVIAAVAVLQVGADITVRGLWTRSGPVLRQTFSGRLGQPQLLPEHVRVEVQSGPDARGSTSGAEGR
jgi:low temperature requirement protein LtrA